MITPAYSPTATERVLPRMALDFTTGVLDSRVTVTRALNTATRVNASGLIETVNANLPRFDYDPVTLAPKGLLIEESRANLLPQSSGFNTGSWTKANATITSGATTSPDGTVNASKLAENTTAVTDHPVYTTGATVTVIGTTYTETFYLKASERIWAAVGIFDGAWFRAYFNLSAGTVGTVAAGLTASISAAGNGWYRCTITRTMASLAAFAGVWTANADNSFSFAGTVGSGIFLWGAQLEAGAFATSYIPTTTTSLTRNADAVSMTGTNFSDWYNASEGAFLAKFSFPSIPASQFRYVLSANDGTGNNVIAVAGNTTSNVPAGRVFAGAVLQASMGGGSIVANQQTIGVLAYKLNSFAYCQNGATTGTDVSGTVPTLNRLDIGSLSGSFACCHIQRVSYWPQRIINNEALAFSK
jgi:hypothetical protein